ncbi:bifunctional 4-hydroxy-2-oxoglutarate aldolase/2-dehydro-3-deoxy-phosphogluconate aldolase [Sphingosinicellaceae bacterium]|nr:bifunctional 4-hydroxy-2-oxoglutarate aldolase/2-dehydro-3-deoxy-phosphogluconate aldolase [Sphingosinicellaceae bacterium]
MTVDEIMGLAPVVPVLVIDDAGSAGELAKALVAGGIAALEVTLRTPAALDAIRAMAAIPGAVPGAGTVLNADDARRAVDAGARFLVSPGLSEGVARAALDLGVPLLAGVATGTEIMRGLDLGLTRFKFFPAETSGGAAAVAAFGGPFAQVLFCPTGGITAGTAPGYLKLANVACVGGSWLAPRGLVASGDWSAITALARTAAGLSSAI